ncbi:MAG: hypothetical protein JNL51_11900 [Chitinophagaceae bacterium]|nr:hypothetical protein [Chitinophagaceae bacterium]
MKRIILAAGLGMGIFSFVLASTSGYHGTANNNETNYYDTVPKKDTTAPEPEPAPAPAPDTTTIVSHF